jgi:hypothetical protein
LRDHLAASLDAYGLAKRLKTLKGMMPFEYICRNWADDPDRFRLCPTHPMPRQGANLKGRWQKEQYYLAIRQLEYLS